MSPKRPSAPDAIAEFMDGLATRGYEPALAKATGAVRFDVVDGGRTERWILTLNRGTLDVSRGDGAADLVVRLDRPLFERIVRGRANAFAAVLRGEATIEGGESSDLLVQIQRLLPRPRGSGTGVPAGYARRQR
jgi:hypothetical protein